MQITVALFAAYREAVGASSVPLAVPDGTRAGEVWALMAERYGSLTKIVPPTAVAVNDEVRPADHLLADGDRVVLLAPVSGGADPAPPEGSGAASGPAALELVRGPIRVDALLEAVRHPGAGAVVLFLGTVRERSRGRDVDHLEYEAYEALARTEMARIAAHAADRWGVRLAVAHRLGTLAVGEISVAIAVAAPHRREAFEAGRFAIDTLKQTVPIWKKEVWSEGAEWIGHEDRPASAPR